MKTCLQHHRKVNIQFGVIVHLYVTAVDCELLVLLPFTDDELCAKIGIGRQKIGSTAPCIIDQADGQWHFQSVVAVCCSVQCSLGYIIPKSEYLLIETGHHIDLQLQQSLGSFDLEDFILNSLLFQKYNSFLESVIGSTGLQSHLDLVQLFCWVVPTKVGLTCCPQCHLECWDDDINLVAFVNQQERVVVDIG